MEGAQDFSSGGKKTQQKWRTEQILKQTEDCPGEGARTLGSCRDNKEVSLTQYRKNIC